MIVHVIGDSRVRSFGRIPNAALHQINGISIHAICQLGLNIDLSPWAGQPGIGLFVFGEIDARVHLPIFANHQGNSEAAAAASMINRFMDVVQSFCKTHNLQCVICAVIPAIDLATATPDAVIPTSGSLQDRINRVTLLNQHFIEECARRDIIYFDPHTPFVTEQGHLDRKYTDGIVHLSDDCQEHVKNSYLAAIESAHSDDS